jgi:hypothetical protein
MLKYDININIDVYQYYRYTTLYINYGLKELENKTPYYKVI